MITVIGPYFLYRYDTTVFPKFIERAKKVTPNENNKEIKRIEKKYKLFFTKKYYYITFPWTVMALTAILSRSHRVSGSVRSEKVCNQPELTTS